MIATFWKTNMLRMGNGGVNNKKLGDERKGINNKSRSRFVFLKPTRDHPDVPYALSTRKGEAQSFLFLFLSQ